MSKEERKYFGDPWHPRMVELGTPCQVPTDEPCWFCEESFTAGDRGAYIVVAVRVKLGSLTPIPKPIYKPAHRECMTMHEMGPTAVIAIGPDGPNALSYHDGARRVQALVDQIERSAMQ